jgi:hypothetical protein
MKTKTKRHNIETPSDSAEEIAQTEMPRATAEEIAQKVIIKVLADQFNRLTRQHARILALNRIFIERGIISGKKPIAPGVWSVESYDGADKRNGGRCPVCYRTGEHVADWAVCREHAVRWRWEPYHPNNPDPAVPADIESFRAVDPFYEPRPLCYAFRYDRLDVGLTVQIENALIETVLENDPPEELVKEEYKKEEWLRIRREEALQIDAQTAKVDCTYGDGFDPYGVEPDLPPEFQCIGREYFARRPGGDIWVSFHDLPKATCEALWRRLREEEWEEECFVPFDE